MFADHHNDSKQVIFELTNERNNLEKELNIQKNANN